MHYCQKINFFLWTVWAPSVFGAVWLCRWVVTHSLCRFQLLWPRSCCLHHTEHPFGFSEGWNRYALALLILRTSGWIPHRQNCLPVMAHYESSIHTVAFFFILFILSKANKKTVRTDLKFERRPRSLKIRPTDTSSHCFTLIWFCVTLIKIWIDSSYPEGNFGENQLLDGSISLSPLYPVQEATICTSVPHNASFHQVFTWLHHVRE